MHQSLFKTPDDEATEEEKRPRMDNVIPVDWVKSSLALDFDDAQDMIYWTDVQAHSISRAHLNGTGQQVIVSTNLGESFVFMGRALGASPAKRKTKGERENEDE